MLAVGDFVDRFIHLTRIITMCHLIFFINLKITLSMTTQNAVIIK